MIFDYGAGNLFSIQAALKKEGVQSTVTKTGKGMGKADALLLPGVGSFDQAAKALPMDGIRDAVRSGKPVLGICLGLQLFFARSEEGHEKGLSLLAGEVRRLPSSVKVPQIGWNTLSVKRENELVKGLADDPWVYYVNSFYPETEGAWVVATSEYGVRFPCVVAERNVFGTQFHPEKSGIAGRAMLQNFIEAVKK
jgi:imidazole glycerol-phosphate synthase subunit HisH